MLRHKLWLKKVKVLEFNTVKNNLQYVGQIVASESELKDSQSSQLELSSKLEAQTINALQTEVEE